MRIALQKAMLRRLRSSTAECFSKWGPPKRRSRTTSMRRLLSRAVATRFASKENMRLPKFAAWLIDAVRGKGAPDHSGSGEQEIPQETDESAPTVRKSGKSKAGAEARNLVLSGRAPDDLSVPSLDLSEINETFTLPARLECFELKLARSSVQTLPAGLRVAHRIDLTGCAQLTQLP